MIEFKAKDGKEVKFYQFDGRNAVPNAVKHCQYYMLHATNGIIRMQTGDWVIYYNGQRTIIPNEIFKMLKEYLPC